METTFLRPLEMDASPPRRMNKARLPPGYDHPGILDCPLPPIPQSPLRRPRSPPAPRAPPAERGVRVLARPTGPPRAAEPLPDRRAPCPPQVHRRAALLDTTSEDQVWEIIPKAAGEGERSLHLEREGHGGYPRAAETLQHRR